MKKYLIGNWKSHKNLAEARSWAAAFAQQTSSIPDQVEVVVAPPFSLLPTVADGLADSQAKLAVQDLSPFDAGSYTGAVSIRNLDGLSVEYAIVGHSERRRYFKETNQDVARKIDQALSADITPIVCVDEDYVTSQAAAINEDYLADCLVAYEPVGAIGTGNNVDVGKVKEVKKQINQNFGEVPVLYGGSVNPENVAEYTLVCDGVLVGGASLKPDQFSVVGQNSV